MFKINELVLMNSGGEITIFFEIIKTKKWYTVWSLAIRVFMFDLSKVCQVGG